ncbi:MAG: hypothetical protein WC889_08395 [Myxococcota bacterium]|jgi:hypothetical protein
MRKPMSFLPFVSSEVETRFPAACGRVSTALDTNGEVSANPSEKRHG